MIGVLIACDRSCNAWNCLLKGRKRRKVRWSNTRTRRKRKGSEDDEDDGDNSEEESSEEDSEEEEDDSDEDYKVERRRKRRHRERRSSDSSTSSDDDLPPNDDPCKHCGLPNHPELVGGGSRSAPVPRAVLPIDPIGSFRSYCATRATTATTRPV